MKRTTTPLGTSLLRTLGPWSAASIVVGTIIGSGIFLVPKSMVGHVGTPLGVLALFAIGGLLSLAGALTYAELGAALPHAGGEYVYLREAYGPWAGFMYGWMLFWVGKSGAIAALGTAFVLYLGNFWPALESTLVVIPLPIGSGGGPLLVTNGQLLAMLLILGLGGLNYFGLKVGAGVQNAVTALKMILILAIVGLAALLGGGSVENLTSSVEHTGGVSGFFAALVASLWAYDGWNNLSMVSGEVQKPDRNIPRALIGGVSTVMAVYAATNLAYFYVLTAEQVATSDRVASEAARSFLGQAGGDAVALAAMVSIFAALNGSILSGARVPYAMSRDHLFFGALGRVHPKYRTPHAAILAQCGWSAVLVSTGRYEQLFTAVIFAAWIFYAATAAGVFVLRYRKPHLERPHRAFGYPVVPALFVVMAVCLVVMTLRDSPRESLMGLILMAPGIPAYRAWQKKSFHQKKFGA